MEEESSQTSYAVKLPAFEGPLDLLLHLIKTNEINIYDIPIALITQQYLDYLKMMKTLNLAIAGEFIVMAATLIYIKSKTLLPIEETPLEEQEEDPRPSWSAARWSTAIQRSGPNPADREDEWRDVLAEKERKAAMVTLTDLSMFDLLDALQKVMERVPSKRSVDILIDELTVKDRMSMILSGLETADGIDFLSLFEADTTRAAIIVTFLALLELIRIRLVWIQQNDHFGPIRIFKEKAATTSQPEEEIDGGSGS
jgi:segregation and condensation protein A